MTKTFKAVIWDFGGVFTSSPFDAFARYEADQGLPADFIRTVNATNPDTNAWARLERSEVDRAEFVELFEAEARALGRELDATRVLDALQTQLRPEMVDVLGCVASTHLTAIVTNNLRGDATGEQPTGDLSAVMDLVDVVVESSKVGCRKPEPRFYELACEMLGVRPGDCVLLDDLGVNLKPARAMGMTTIKVVDAPRAIAELEMVLGLSLR
jgi:putative hydrolase of the HAD superfamily